MTYACMDLRRQSACANPPSPPLPPRRGPVSANCTMMPETSHLEAAYFEEVIVQYFYGILRN